jgi:hypothetical protein
LSRQWGRRGAGICRRLDPIAKAVYGRIREESRLLLRQYEAPTGFEAPINAHIVIGRWP